MTAPAPISRVSVLEKQLGLNHHLIQICCSRSRSKCRIPFHVAPKHIRTFHKRKIPRTYAKIPRSCAPIPTSAAMASCIIHDDSKMLDWKAGSSGSSSHKQPAPVFGQKLIDGHNGDGPVTCTTVFLPKSSSSEPQALRPPVRKSRSPLCIFHDSVRCTQ